MERGEEGLQVGDGCVGDSVDDGVGWGRVAGDEKPSSKSALWRTCPASRGSEELLRVLPWRVEVEKSTA